MDIKYIHDNDIHEKYILNQLDEKEKLAYEAFLKSSPQAQKELQDTRRLIGRLKNAGAGAMRREIEEQVSALRNPKTDWSIMYKAAAVLFILVLLPAIFYYQDRFADQPEISEQPLPAEYQHQAQNAQQEEEAVLQNEPISAEQKDRVKEEAVAETPAVKAKRSVSSGKAPAKQDDFKVKKEESNVQQILAEAVDDDLGKAVSAAGSGGRTTDLQPMENSDMLENERIQLDSKTAAALQRTSQVAQSMPAKSDVTDVASSEAPSGIISMDYIPRIRSFTFIHNDDSLKLKMQRTSMRDAFPDLLKMSYSQDSSGLMQVNIYVSDRLHSFERSDINVTWENSTLITIHFSDKAAYRLKLEQGQKTALRLK